MKIKYNKETKKMNIPNNLQKRIFLYSVDTTAFYTTREMEIQQIIWDNNYKNQLEQAQEKLEKFENKLKIKDLKETEKLVFKAECDELIIKIDSLSDKTRQKKMREKVKSAKESLKTEMNNFKGVRVLREDAINKKIQRKIYDGATKTGEVEKIEVEPNKIAMFESTLTRTLKIDENETTMDILIVERFYQRVLDDLVLNGFDYKNDHYIFYAAGAGATREKKSCFIKEKVWKKHEKSLMCGLTIKDINEGRTGREKGININKFLAYKALPMSGTVEWTNFSIDRCIVVDDLELTLNKIVDYIDSNTYLVDTRQMPIDINFTDGCGMILPRVSNKSIQFRLPHFKGLLVPFKFDTFVKEIEGATSIIPDIYGDLHDIIKENICIIFVKSQFKLWKHYDNWDSYKKAFKDNRCEAAICHIEESHFDNVRLSYQSLQTLVDVTDSELKEIASQTNEVIKKIGTDRQTMLNVLGATEYKQNKNYYQQSLEIYPELLSDTYSRELLKGKKASMVKEARYGRIEVESKNVYICPDLYAFCEFLFTGNKEPKGLLNDGEVYTELYPNNTEVDILRFPHLYIEHPIRTNVVDDKNKKWLISKGIYTSVNDIISKILMFDNDGDRVTIVGDKNFVKIAKRNMENVVPLHYNLGKAEPEQISQESILNGLKIAYNEGNIGEISNIITKIFNSDEPDIDAVKWIVMKNNEIIDFSKTRYKSKMPIKMKKLFDQYKRKVKPPYFFTLAKKTPEEQLEKRNKSTVNRLSDEDEEGRGIIVDSRINFRSDGLGKFNYTKLMANPTVSLNQENQNIIDKYHELDLKKHYMGMSNDNGDSDNKVDVIFWNIRNQILKVNNDKSYVVDVLIKHLYMEKESQYKTTLWSAFGDIIVKNIKNNLENDGTTGSCDGCGERFEITRQRQTKCLPCMEEAKTENARLRKQRERSNKNVAEVSR